MSARLILLPLLFLLLLGQSLDAHENDGCPQNFRRCNDECLDRNNKHTLPCENGPWGKCLSPSFPFFCPLTNTCIAKDEICGDFCFNGNPGSFWYDHWFEREKDWRSKEWVKKDNLWELEEGAFDTMGRVSYNIEVPKWLERYNCNGECKTYLESCDGACDHPEGIKNGGITLNLTYAEDLFKCGRECRSEDNMRGYHDCGDECLPQGVQCNGACPNSTNWMTGPQWKCGNECRPDDKHQGVKWAVKWRGCPDGTCRDNGVSCDGPLPGTCPPDQVLCRYSSWIRGTDFECRSKSTHYICNETRAENVLQNLFGKHEDDWCNEYSEQCQGECRQGFFKCLIYDRPSCADPEKYVKCGEECKESSKFYKCNGSCIATTEMCNGLCANGFRECEGKCVSSSDSSFTDCNGKCQSSSKQCDGSCSSGYFKVGDICKPDKEKWKHYECNGAFLDLESPCIGVCKGSRKKCGERCLQSWDTQTCNGECIHSNDPCNGTCKSSWQVPCGDRCIGKNEPCEGRCHDEEYPFVCMALGYSGEMCIHIKKIGDGQKDCKDGSDETTNCWQGWRCNGILQCINEPCHGHGPGEKKCPTTIEKQINSWTNKTYKMYYCSAEDQCKFEGVPCAGKCVVDMKDGRSSIIKAEHQFACHDGSKCVRKEGDLIQVDICNGRQDCPDGSDEISECNGDIDCKGRIHVKGPLQSDIKFVCKSGDEQVRMSQYCDGVDNCKDASDEKGCDACPGLARCENGQFTCANVPCNNTVHNTATTRAKLDDLTCEFSIIADTTGAGTWRLCKEPNEEAKCVKGAGTGWDNLVKGKITKGDLCNGECLGSYPGKKAYRCGDTCLPLSGAGMPTFSCNGLCEHLNKDVKSWSEKLVPCGDYCVKRNSLEYSGRWKNAIRCDGECRLLGIPEEQLTNRKPCNGVCVSGKQNQPWFSCASRDQCFPNKEWCDGVPDCKDGTDEASCNQCPEIRKCTHPQHPLANQTSSKGPGFPDYVCLNEPCGECSDPDTFPCGNNCIPTDKICPLSGQCSPSRFQCGKECLHLAKVCDGKVDCKDGNDEAACDDNKGSWMCNGNIQSRSIPC